MLNVTRHGVLKKHHTHAGTQAGSRTHCGLSDVIFSDVSSVSARHARRWLRVRPGCVFDGNHGSRLEFESRVRRAELVNGQRIVAVH